MKRILAILLALVMIVAVAACGSGNNDSTNDAGGGTSTAPSGGGTSTSPAGGGSSNTGSGNSSNTGSGNSSNTGGGSSTSSSGGTGGDSNAGSGASSEPAWGPPEWDGNPIDITVWVYVAAGALESLQTAAAEFNRTQDKYIVNLSYQGSANEVLTKIRATGAGQLPDLYQTSGNGSAAIMAAKDMYIPAQRFIDAEGYDMSDVIINLKGNYARDGEWQSLPLGNTITGFWYNTEWFEKAGVDPIKDVNSWEDIVVACEKLAAAGCPNVFYNRRSYDFINFSLSAQGIPYVDMDNGQSGIPTRSLYGDEGPTRDAALKYFQCMKAISDNGWMMSTSISSSDSASMFAHGEVGIQLGWVSAANVMFSQAEEGFRFGFKETVTIDRGAVNLGQPGGGGTVFIGNNGDDARAWGAWEFYKFLLRPEYSAAFALESGYLPITTSGFYSDTFQEWATTVFPSAQHLFEVQLESSPEVRLARMPMSSDYDAIVVEILGKLANEPSYTPEMAVRELAERLDEAIELYNLGMGY